MKEMTDIVFSLTGHMLPSEHVYEMWREVVRVLPWLDQEPAAGVLPLRPPGRSNSLLLSRRSRLILRVPVSAVQEASALCGQELNVGGEALTVGESHERPLQPAPTLHAQLVASELDEAAFLEAMAAELSEAGIVGKLICGKRLALPGTGGKIEGYSLVVHELKPEDALALQRRGVGGERHFGCGIFIPYKVIANLDT